MLRPSIALFALLMMSITALGEQDYTGTYIIQSEMGLIKLTLQQEDQGQVLGQLTGAGMDCLIQGSPEASGIS
ncbi:MAG: hypothetical protein KAJ37_14010, partial [Candidatus Krumholzibacteria bacterium]|nr:hypothetical protein [Candidatus Krumholzibacteria bacterium]